MGSKDRDGSRVSFDSISMSSLAPKYSKKAHKLPLTLLRAELDTSDLTKVRPKNIALAGPYGSGKSSVLQKLVEKLPGRTVIVSLSTLSTTDQESDASADRKGRALPTTNYIQKEIVKQLLYREPASNVPDSRFRRIEPVRKDHAAFVGMYVSVMGFIVATLTRLPEALTARLFPKQYVFGWILTAILIFLLGTFARQLFISISRRFDVSGISAGGVGIQISNRSSYYFDEFIDEIIYFFQRTKVDVVIFEDLDRFDDPHIYDSLRSLNSVLNNSKGLGRQIQFVYAIRDSLFDSKSVKRGSRRRVDPSGDRTKFFDLIVPLVPFITDKNSLDLLRKEVKDLAHVPNETVLDLVAPYVTDMRMVLNIRNEYAVFAAQLLGAKETLGGLNAESLLAMVVYKNLAPKQFEKIRSHESELDIFFDELRKGVAAKIGADQSEIAALRQELALGRITATRARWLAARSRKVLPALYRQSTNASVQLNSISIPNSRVWPVAELEQSDAWADILTAQTIIATFTSNAIVTVSNADFATYLGNDAAYTALTDQAKRTIQRRISDLEDRLKVLRRASLKEMIQHPNVILPVGDQHLSVIQLQKLLVRSSQRVVLELLRAGFIDQNYAHYSAKYYGGTLSVKAMTFVTQHIQPNVAHTFYLFASDADADAVIAKYGKTLFDDVVGRNIALVERLCVNNGPLLNRVAANLSTGDDESRDFVMAFIVQSEHRDVFYKALSAYWDEALDFLLRSSGLDEKHHLSLFNAAVLGQVQPNTQQQSDSDVLATARDHFSELPLLKLELDTAQAESIAIQLSNLGMKASDLASLNPVLRNQFILVGGWIINAANLFYLAGNMTVPTLNDLKSRNDGTYDYVMTDLGLYLDVLDALGGIAADGSGEEAIFVTDAFQSNPLQVNRLLGFVAAEVRLVSLSQVPPETWSALAQRGLVLVTGENINDYVEALGPDLDAELSGLLTKEAFEAGSEISDQAAMAILNATDLGLERKLLLIRQTVPASYTANHLNQCGAESLPELLGERFPDDAASFNSAVELGASTAIAVAAASLSFPDFIGQVVMADKTGATLIDASTLTTIKKVRLIETIVTKGPPPLLTGAAIIPLLETNKIVTDLRMLVWLAQEKMLHPLLVPLFVKCLPALARAEVDLVLQKLGGNYDELTRAGSSLRMEKSDSHRALLAYLRDTGGPIKRFPDAKNWITVIRQ